MMTACPAEGGPERTPERVVGRKGPRTRRFAAAVSLASVALAASIAAPASALAVPSLSDVLGSLNAPGQEASQVDESEGAESEAQASGPIASIAADSVSQSVYTAAGISVAVPAGVTEVSSVDGIFVVATQDDFCLQVAQEVADIEDYGGTEGFEEKLAGLLDDNPEMVIYGDGAPAVYETCGGASAYMLYGSSSSSGYGSDTSYYCAFVPTLDGGLSYVWMEWDAENDGLYADYVESVVESIALVDASDDSSVAEDPSSQETITENGVTFGRYGMEYDSEYDAWYREGGETGGELLVYTFGDSFDGEPVSSSDLYDAIVQVVGYYGTVVAASELENGDTDVYLYASLDIDGFIEVFCLVPLSDGTITTVVCLCDMYDAEASDLIASFVRGIELESGSSAALLDDIAGAGSGELEDIDLEYLESLATSA